MYFRIESSIMEKIFNRYQSLRREIDLVSDQLNTKHKNHMQCKKGCDFCCMNYSIFPIEFNFIVNALKKKNEKPLVNNEAEEEVCIFLINNQCSIYSERPIICRTHGLPLLYMNNNNEWELSACDLNFTDFEMNDFSEENTFPQDKFNSKLFILNKEYLKTFKENKYGEFDLIPLKSLSSYL